MKLEILNHTVDDIKFGDKLSYDSGVLTINKNELEGFALQQEHITECKIYIAKPGDEIRMCPVKEAVEPRVKPGRDGSFPGYTGKPENCGSGILHALKKCSVIAVGKHWGGFQDGIIDMSGPGAELTYFSKLNNIVFVLDTDEEDEKQKQQKRNSAIRKTIHKLAEFVASATEDTISSDVETYDLPPITKRSQKTGDLPSAALVLQTQTQMEEDGYNTMLYGWDMNHILPTFIHPNEIFDGAVVSGSFMPCSSKWSTYDYQNAPVIKELYRAHGVSINFLGVILTNLNVAFEQKRRSALYVANLAKSLGADCAIVAEEGYGNPDADFVECIKELETKCIKTVGLTNECNGRDGTSQPLMTLDESLDAIVSCGNVSEIIELGPMGTVLGDLDSLARDGLSGGWEDDEILGPSVRSDGSIIMENNSMFCGDQVLGWADKTVTEF